MRYDMYCLNDLKAFEYKLKHIHNNARIRYFNAETYVLKATSEAVYVPDLDTIYLQRKPLDMDEEEYLIYLFIVLHEVIHSTAHPTRLNREYMSHHKFNSRRSIYAYLRDHYQNFTLSPEDYDRQADIAVSLNYYKEEILADTVAIKIFKKMGISTKQIKSMNYINKYKKKLYNRCRNEASYQEHLKDISKKVTITYNYLCSLLELT